MKNFMIFYASISNIYRYQFEEGLQHDCHEFLNYIISQLNGYVDNKFNSILNTNNQLIHFNDFKGFSTTTIKCNKCHFESSTEDIFLDVIVPLHSGFTSIDEFIGRNVYLNDDNKYYCVNCMTYEDAIAKSIVKTPPKIFVFYINKFNNHLNDRRSETSYKESKVCKEAFKPQKSFNLSIGGILIKYKLYALIKHIGLTSNSGHYYSIINTDLITNNEPTNVWIKINDNIVQKLDERKLNQSLNNFDSYNSDTPFLAFYKME